MKERSTHSRAEEGGRVLEAEVLGDREEVVDVA